MVERQEQESGREPGRLNGPDRRGLRAVAPPAARGRCADRQRRGRAREVVAERRRQPDQRRAGGARKCHHRQRVTGERLAAQDHVPAHTAASTATIVPASSAFTMNGNVNSCSDVGDEVQRQRRVRRSFASAARRGGGAPRAGRRRPAARRSCAAPRSARRRGSTACSAVITSSTATGQRAPAGEVDHAIEVGEQRVDVVGDEQHRDALGGRDPPQQRRDRTPGWAGRGCPAARRGSAAGAADQRLGDQQPLLLAAGELADRAVGVSARAHQRDHLVDPAALRSPQRCGRAASAATGSPQRAPSSPRCTRSMPRTRIEASNAPALRQVADLGSGPASAGDRARSRCPPPAAPAPAAPSSASTYRRRWVPARRGTRRG